MRRAGTLRDVLEDRGGRGKAPDRTPHRRQTAFRRHRTAPPVSERDWDDTSFYPSAALRGLSSLLAKEVTDPRTCRRVGRWGRWCPCGHREGRRGRRKGRSRQPWPASHLLPITKQQVGRATETPAWGAEPAHSGRRAEGVGARGWGTPGTSEGTVLFCSVLDQ